ncbi:efflux transporter outer membrane subunit [Lysobacter sp. MMG2]|uniref:efflux transporter outer membrane subunit n=1 Tax=Lysobacter sp. MMG2 TaxID=2801338 RepID=UPI001C230193|nr:efflux transporter outer membrane subunit [Lysobacter sp. MMG2]MBU8976047.1 efflux transporter outer membrane subunit [Lysobacter sp. MMG2]
MRILVPTALLLFSLGCTLGPDYVRPTIDTPDAWRIAPGEAEDLANTQWWTTFNDPVLDELIDTALAENRDVRIAAARVDQFLGALTATRSRFFPTVGYDVDASRAKASRVGQPPIPAGADPYFTLYQGSLGASWQIDLFGRVRRLSEAAQARVYASEQARRGVVLSLVTSVAASYITLRQLDRQLEIAQATANNFGETARIFDLRHKAGIVSLTEVSQIRSQREQALATIPVLEQQIAAVENLISITLGRNPGPIPRGLTIDQLVPPRIPADLPSSLLERRPDILQAEQNLVAANANIGATRALYFPDLTLTGALGSTSTSFGDFLTGPASAWLVAANVAGPIFTFGAIKGQVRTAEAQKEEAVLVYQQTILNAMRETDDALTGTVKKAEELQRQEARVRALRDSARLSRAKFEYGMAGYVEVLIADNELFAAEIALVRVRAERNTQIVQVYRAMGGGWVDAAQARTTATETGSEAAPRSDGGGLRR